MSTNLLEEAVELLRFVESTSEYDHPDITAFLAKYDEKPVRCRIGCTETRWQCYSSGCGAAGDLINGRLIDPQGKSLARGDVPEPFGRPFDPRETCLFDREAPCGK